MPDHDPEDEEIPFSVDPSEFVDVFPGLRWECIRCGDCCGNVFSRTWIDMALRDHVGEPVDGYCQYLDRDTNLCTIHDRRPNICRGYPFIIRKKGDMYKLQIHGRCRGLGKGPFVDVEEKIRELVRYSEEDLGITFLIEGGGEEGHHLRRIG